MNETTQPAVMAPVEPTVRRHAQTVRDLIACCSAWEPEVRILGNVRAEDAAAALAYMLPELEAKERYCLPPRMDCSELCQPDGLKFDAFGELRTRYVRVTLNRSHCVMPPSEGDCYVEDARNAGDLDWERYVVRDVWLSEREFEDLPEHDGF